MEGRTKRSAVSRICETGDPGPGRRDLRQTRCFPISTYFDDERNMSFCGAGTANLGIMIVHLRFHTPRGNSNGADSLSLSIRLPGSRGRWADKRHPQSPQSSSRQAGQGEKALQSPVELWWGTTQGSSARKADIPCSVNCQCQRKRQGWGVTSPPCNFLLPDDGTASSQVSH